MKLTYTIEVNLTDHLRRDLLKDPAAVSEKLMAVGFDLIGKTPFPRARIDALTIWPHEDSRPATEPSDTAADFRPSETCPTCGTPKFKKTRAAKS